MCEALNGAHRYFSLQNVFLRGREAVRADRRLRTDEKHIRAKSAILYKCHPKPPLLLSITVFFGTDALHIRAKKHGWRAERAMAVRRHRQTSNDTSNCGARTCADGGPSARIADCVRTKIRPHAIGDLG